MAKKPASKASAHKSAAKGKKPGVTNPKVAEFIDLILKNKPIQRILKKNKQVNAMALARGLGYTFTKAELVAAMKRRWGTKAPGQPETCIVIRATA